MNTFVTELWALFLLVIISDGVGAALAARTCWRIRHRAQLARVLAIFMATLAVVDLSDTVNSVVNSSRPANTVAMVQALAGRTLRSAATWYLALKLMNGYSSQHKGEDTDETTSPTA